MSIDVNWETLTGGPDGVDLAETVRAFVHDKFQQVTLPRFIRSVKVLSFDFGNVAPEIEIKDICDPLPDFYEEDEGGSGEEEEGGEDLNVSGLHQRPQPYVDTRLPGLLRSGLSPGDQLGSPMSRTPTPGIPGGTSSLNYFHLPLGTGISGTATPLAAVAGGHNWPDHGYHSRETSAQPAEYHHRSMSASSITPPSTAELPSRPPSQHFDATRRSSRAGLDSPAIEPFQPTLSPSPPLPAATPEKSVEDIQVVARVRYHGDVKLSLTAEILLDYPMPSFVCLPLKLNITGLTFDGVAIVAYIKKKAHFCFLSPEDADALVGGDVDLDLDAGGGPSTTHADASGGQHGRASKIGGLLEEIRVESEIGETENGKQVLKNVGKVEKFVLEQVRRIFDDEFVYPSYWTFLV
ncbi:hypothetical protein BDY21DRAFT_292909 [Lineolata rhizophorae]|uniref:Mitochondrial distribution and morphology protein 12 n=1 Tax=Lineolata rhizophorae TaxID=578093 RepID=A0A6A6NNY2_9PEZI|nr:hypothetical protein BDY21DRAFT_292909 [Lineolata rhizophorae]